MSDKPPTLSSDTTVRFGRVFGISLGNLFLLIGGVVTAIVTFKLLQGSVEGLVKSHEAGRIETQAEFAKISANFQAALTASETKFQVALENDRKLAESERKRIELEQANMKERLTGFNAVVESIRPVVAALPVLDQRVASTERAVNEFREVAAEVRAQRTTTLEVKDELKEMRAEIKAARNTRTSQ